MKMQTAKIKFKNSPDGCQVFLQYQNRGMEFSERIFARQNFQSESAAKRMCVFTFSNSTFQLDREKWTIQFNPAMMQTMRKAL
jgi:hypothetical protein